MATPDLPVRASRYAWPVQRGPYRMRGSRPPSQAAPEADALLPSDPVYAAPGDGLRLVRRHVRWSAWARWSVAAILVSLTYPVVFPNVESKDGEGALLWTLGMMVWCAPLSRLFAGPDRVSGMRHVRRELWIGPDPQTGSPSIMVDGKTVGTARGTTVWLCEIISSPRGYIFTYWSVSLLIGGTLYEVERTLDEAAMRRIATLLARALGTPSAVPQESAGGDPTNNNIDELASMASLFLPQIASCFVAAGRIGPHDPRVILVGALAMLARVSVGFWSLARIMTPPRAAKRFASRFPGATPACPMPWLMPRRTMRTMLVAHALLFAAVGLVALARC
jgi:hypothetical protein